MKDFSAVRRGFEAWEYIEDNFHEHKPRAARRIITRGRSYSTQKPPPKTALPYSLYAPELNTYTYGASKPPSLLQLKTQCASVIVRLTQP